MEQCVAIADYEATTAEEISFKKGDTITVVAKGTSSGFWEGILNSERMRSHQSSSSPRSKKRQQVDLSGANAAGEETNKETRGLFPNCFVSSNLRPNLPPTFVDKAVALYDYRARDNSELSMSRHDLITVVRSSTSPGWWCGYNETATKRLSSSGEVEDVVNKKCGSAKRPLLFPTNFVTSKIAQASFSFTGRQAHELSFSAGDVILVHRRWNDGWWEGTIGTRRGIFPSNYTLPNVATTEPPFFCQRCKLPYSSTSCGSLGDCKECAKNEEIVNSMLLALQDFEKGVLPHPDIFAYVDLEPKQGGRSALLTVADTVDRSVRKEKVVEEDV